jgi:RNA polymerase sigma-70 factor (ECF subfamily)
VIHDDLDGLIARAQDGDVRAFETLLAGHLGQVRRFARAFVRSPSDADDLAQEALLKVYKSLRLFRYQSAFSTWLYAVVRSVFLDAAKSRASKERSREEELGPRHEVQPSGEASADERLAQEEVRQKVWNALRQVPLEFRTAVVLFDIEGHSYDEIAAIEGVAVGTVKSRLSRGREHLRRVLGEAGEKAKESRLVEPPVEAGTPAQAASSNVRGSGT